MYYLKKTLEVSASHILALDYDSPCNFMHGHNWIITVYCRRVDLNKNGMIVDFKTIKKIIHETMDHKYLNEVFPFNPTAENIAEWIARHVPYCYKVTVQESTNNEVTYEI